MQTEKTEMRAFIRDVLVTADLYNKGTYRYLAVLMRPS